MHRVVHSRFLREGQNATVVQLTGSIGGSIPEFGGSATTARLANALGASAHHLHAPMLVTETAVRNELVARHIQNPVLALRAIEPQVRPGTPRAFHHRHNPRHILPRPPGMSDATARAMEDALSQADGVIAE